MAPVVRDADSLRLSSLAERIAAARDAEPDRGGDSFETESTFTLSSPAPGPMLTTPPLASHQVAALGIGAAAAKPVAIEREPGEYVVAVHPVGTLALGFDSGVIDVGYAGHFLDHVRRSLETRDWMSEL